MLLIYSPANTERMQYVMQYVFAEQFGIEYKITENSDDYLSSKGNYKIAYADEYIEEGTYFFAHGLLAERAIHKIELQEKIINDSVFLFTHENKAAIGFDVFAAIFYLLSRYEEYSNEPRDLHGNYNFKNSILFKLDALEKPVIEIWLEMLKSVLLHQFPLLQFKQKSASYLLSFDIDVAYAYKHRSFKRTAGGFIKKIFTLNFPAFKDQLQTVLGLKKDMFDTYDYIFSHIKNKAAVFFFNMGKYDRFDKNPSRKNRTFQNLICFINKKHAVGLHPSYSSNTNKKLLATEKHNLEKILNKKVTLSRQHYLKLNLPETYNNLIKLGIEQDFTIGYYYNYGFRAGTCNSFLFFDLANNKKTGLRLYPYVFMDGSLNAVRNMSIAAAKQKVEALINTVFKYNGIFIPLWHNSTLSNKDEWKSWREVFEFMLEKLAEKNVAACNINNF